MLAFLSRSAFVFLCLPLTFSAHSLAAEAETNSTNKVIPAFKANYTLLHKGDPVGKAVRELSYQEDGKATYHYHTDIKWLIFSDKRSETSQVIVDNNQVIPQHYVYSREGTGRDKNYEWQYDIANKKAKDLKKERQITLDITEGLQDKLSYHLQHRLNLIENPEQKRFSYPVISTSGSIKDYVYQYDGEEELMLPYGLVKTIRLKREVTAKKRITYAWFAPELNYLLVKLYQVKAGAEQFEAQLASIENNK